jgi:hypothetical protein
MQRNDSVVTFLPISCRILWMVSFPGNASVAPPLSAPALQKELTRLFEQELTGLVKIAFLPGEDLTLLVRSGKVRQVYVKDREGSRRDLAWEERLQADRVARLIVQHAPGRRLLFEKVIQETPEKGVAKQSTFKTSNLKKLFTSMENAEAASLVRVFWKNAEALVLVPGSQIPTHQAVFFSGSEPDIDTFAISQVESYPEPGCDLLIYRGSPEIEAWLEVYLNVLFEWYCNYLLTRYSYLTGKVMVTSIMQSLLILSSQRGWEIGRFGNQVVDQTVFASPNQAAEAYREILSLAGEHIQAVIGASLLQSIRRQSLVSTNSFYQNLQKTYELTR